MHFTSCVIKGLWTNYSNIRFSDLKLNKSSDFSVINGLDVSVGGALSIRDNQSFEININATQ